MLVFSYKGTNFLIKLPNFWAENFQINFIFLGIARSAPQVQIKTDNVCPYGFVSVFRNGYKPFPTFCACLARA
jgi:hypothetical protein